MKNPRGLLIDMEGFIQSKTDDAFIKKLSSELNSKFNFPKGGGRCKVKT